MPKLTVYVDEKPVVLEPVEEDDMVNLACDLESMGYKINPAFPNISVDGKTVDHFTKVDLKKIYKFGK